MHPVKSNEMRRRGRAKRISFIKAKYGHLKSLNNLMKVILYPCSDPQHVFVLVCAIIFLKFVFDFSALMLISLSYWEPA